jgi:putative colanic acid biosynthesis acetyltransferase WcaF
MRPGPSRAWPWWAIPGRAAFRLLRVVSAVLFAGGRRVRRARWLAALRVRAFFHQARVHLDVAGDVRLGRRVRVTVQPGSETTLRIGRRCRIGPDGLLELRGGLLELGEGVDIRHGCVIGVGGSLVLQGPNLVQHGCTLQCDEAITIESQVGLGWYVTIIDSSHRAPDPARWFVHHVESAPIVLEHDTWVAANAVVTRGVRVGACAVVGASSVVVRDVPAGSFVSGVPAQVVAGADERRRTSSS